MKKNRIKNFVAMTLLLFSVTAHGENPKLTPEQIASIRSLLPVGSDIAQTAVLRGEDNQYDGYDEISVASQNTIIRDFDHNGVLDLAVVVEVDPQLLIDFDPARPCDKLDYSTNCYRSFGERTLNIYMNGATTPTFSNELITLNADEGGVFGDPLNGISLNQKGSILMDFYGGSAWRWGHTYTIQFRQDNFYLVGYTDQYSYTLDGSFNGSDINFLTGLEIKTSQKSFEAPVKTKKIRHPVKPLVKFNEIQDRLGQ